MGWTGCLATAEQALNFIAGGHPALVIAETHAHPLYFVALRTFGGDPDNMSSHRQLTRVVHQGKQHENLIAQSISPIGGDKNSAALQIGHVGCVKRGFFLDAQGKYAWAGRGWSLWIRHVRCPDGSRVANKKETIAPILTDYSAGVARFAVQPPILVENEIILSS